MKKIIILLTLVVSAVRGAPLKPDAGYTYSCWLNGWRKLADDRSRDVFGIETSEYGFTLDVADFVNVGFGRLDNPIAYEQALKHKGDKLKNLPAARLMLELDVDGVKFTANTCKAGIDSGVKRLSSVRLWESGRYVQHFDFLELDFRDEKGAKLLCDATLDLVAWPESLTFSLKILPKFSWNNAAIRVSFETGVANWQKEQICTGLWNADEEKCLTLNCDVSGKGVTQSQVAIRTFPGDEMFAGFDPSKNCYVASVKKLKREWKTGYTDIRVYDEFKISISDLSIEEKADQPVEQPGFWQRLFKKNGEENCYPVYDWKNPQYVPFLLDLRPPANITGLCPVLCDSEGRPTGVPVQLSKNWHYDKMGAYLMAYVMLPVDPKFGWDDYKLRIAYGFYGSLPSASHAQLSLIGYGSNNNGRWDQLAIGCWGETICFDMDMSCVDVIITDIRMLMARNGINGTKWSWTDAGWGGDWLMIRDRLQDKYYPKEMKTAYVSHGPCLTDVRHSGYYGMNRELSFTADIKTLRTDDYNRSFQRFEYEFEKDVTADKIWLFKTGRTHHYATPRVAYGNAEGLIKELDVPATLKKGDVLLDNVQFEGPGPWWVAIPGGYHTNRKDWGTGYRAIIIRDFNAVISGSRYSVPAFNAPIHMPSNIDLEIVPPSGIKEFKKGDSVQMDIEFITLPRVADDYYGPNEIFRKHLAENPSSWKSVQREVVGNSLDVKVIGGKLLESYPVIVKANKPEVKVNIKGGVGYVPIRFEGIKGVDWRSLYQIVDGKELKLHQAVHGNDYWQSEYDAATDTYKLTYNLPLDGLPASEWVLK